MQWTSAFSSERAAAGEICREQRTHLPDSGSGIRFQGLFGNSGFKHDDVPLSRKSATSEL
jgi:hypothetical protein